MTAQPRRLPSSCERHPGHPFTGFCAPCLSERLSGLDANASPKLRRSKSFSAVRAPAPKLEPQRHSCDVRARNTLSSLFHLDDNHRHHPVPAAIAAPVLQDQIRPADPAPITEEVELKTMKEHIDLEPQVKKPESTGSFWLAASVFSKKLQKWRRSQKLKKSGNNAGSASTQKAQSEIVVDGFGRRSCDIDRRFSFSIEAGRMSVDEPRFSWDAPRASWDGHLIGGRARFPPMLAVGEGGDGRDPATERWDGKIPVEEESTIPGGTAHTRDYYLDSSSGRRRSLDRSDSVRRQSVEFSEMKPVHIVNQSPSSELFNLHNVIKRDRDDRSESFESAFRDSQKGAAKKKSRKWGKAWNIWGFIYRRGGSRGGGGGGGGGGDGNEVERTFSESWPDMRGTGKISRSNSNVSMRSSSFHNTAGYGSMRKGSLETSGLGKKRRGEFVLERNRSARYSPSHVDNGMLRFYLTPMRGSRRNGLSGKNRHSTSSYSITKTMLGMA